MIPPPVTKTLRSPVIIIYSPSPPISTTITASSHLRYPRQSRQSSDTTRLPRIDHINHNGHSASEVDIKTIHHVRSSANKRDCQVNSMRLYLCVYNYANQAQSRSDSRRFLCPHFYLFLCEDGQMSHEPDPSTTQGVLV
jgi:hypothetical protein